MFEGYIITQTCPWLVHRQWQRGVSQVERIALGQSNRNREFPDDRNNVINHEFSRRVCTPCIITIGRLEFEDKETGRKP